MKLWLDPGFGASGDMLLGVLVGLGCPLESVRDDLAGLGLDGWELREEAVARAGIVATRVEVIVESDPQHHRPWSSIDALLAAATLRPEVIAGARATFRRLGEVEAGIHQVGIDDVRFHEVGALDAIIDIVGTWSARHHLGIDEVHAGPVGVGGGGRVGTAHGLLPTPAPATAELLTGTPITGLDLQAETVTPTGAALLTTMVDAWGPVPDGLLVRSGRGAGGRNPDSHPNVVSGLLVDPATDNGGGVGIIEGATTTRAVVLATNIDDATPEVLGYTIDRLLAAGADDAWLVPIGMKKNRPGNELRVLTRPERSAELAAIVFAETGSLGLRVETVAKHALTRHVDTVSIRGCSVRVKVGPYGAKPEHDDLVAAARATGVAVATLAGEARLAHEHQRGGDGSKPIFGSPT